MTFGARVLDARERFGPVCPGIDPHASLLASWGLDDNADGLARFTEACVEAFAGHVGYVKPQSAFFERHGSRGIAVLEEAIAALRAAGTLVILDVKRGDIGSTAQGYADAYLNPASSLASDAVTVSPYLGFGSLDPFFTTAAAHDAGVFVLALTSNPEGPEVQQARGVEGTVAGGILDQLAERNDEVRPLGSFGAVVGATIGQADEDLDINGPFLVPGIGAQGGTLDDVRRIFGAQAGYVIAATSRAVLSAGPDISSLRAAADAANSEFADLR